MSKIRELLDKHTNRLSTIIGDYNQLIIEISKNQAVARLLSPTDTVTIDRIQFNIMQATDNVRILEQIKNILPLIILTNGTIVQDDEFDAVLNFIEKALDCSDVEKQSKYQHVREWASLKYKYFIEIKSLVTKIYQQKLDNKIERTKYH